MRPTWFFAVPRIFEKLKAGLGGELASLPESSGRRPSRGSKAALAEGAARAGWRGGARRSAGGRCRGRRADVQAASLRPRPRRGGGGQCRRRADPARGAGVLPRDRDPDRRAVGDVGDLRRRDLQPARPSQARHRGPAGARGRDQARRGRRGAGPRRLGDARLPQHAREDRRGDRRRGLAGDRRHRRARRGRLPEDHRPQEGADHQRRRQEHVAGQHRVEAEGGEPAGRPVHRDRRRPPLQRGPDRPRPRLRARLGRQQRPRGSLPGGAGGRRAHDRGASGGRRRGQREDVAGRADQEVRGAARRVAARGRRTDPDDEVKA